MAQRCCQAWLSVKTAMLLSMFIFILTLVALGLSAGTLAWRNLIQSGFEIGIGETNAAVEIFGARLRTVRNDVHALSEGIQTSRLWVTNGDYYNASDPAGFVRFGTETLLPQMYSKIIQKNSAALGFGINSHWNYTNGTSVVDYPQVYFDYLEDGKREFYGGTITAGNIVPPEEELNATSAASISISTVGLVNESDGSKSVRLQDFAYDYAYNYVEERSRSAFPKPTWEDFLLWISIDGNTYHYLTYTVPGISLPTTSQDGDQVQTSISIQGWMPGSDIFDQMTGREKLRGTLMLVDHQERIIATSDLNQNNKVRKNIKNRQNLTGGQSQTSVFDEELGVNHPDATIRAIFAEIHDGRRFRPEEGSEPETYEIGVDGKSYLVVEMGSLTVKAPQPKIQFTMIWFADRSDLLGNTIDRQVAAGLTLLAIAILISILMFILSYRSVVGPLTHLNKSMVALSALDMEEVAKEEEMLEGGSVDFSVKEIYSLYVALDGVRSTITTCLPYLPQVEGNLRLGTLERDIMKGSFLSELSGISSTVSTPKSEALDSRSSQAMSRRAKSQGGSLFGIMAQSFSREGSAGELRQWSAMADSLAVRSAPTTVAASNSTSKRGMRPTPLGRISSATSASSFGTSTPGTDEPIILGSFSGASPHNDTTQAFSPASSVSSGLTPSSHSNSKLQHQELNSELKLQDRAVVAHFRLRADCEYDKNTVSGCGRTFKDASFFLSYYVTKLASEQKGSVFAMGTNEISVVWSSVAQAEHKAVEAATGAVEKIIEKSLTVFAGSDLSIPIITCGISRGTVLLGTTGTLLKRTYICEGAPAQQAAILSSVAQQIRTHMLTDVSVKNGAEIFAEFRPVEQIRFPEIRSVLGVQREGIVTAFECIGLRANRLSLAGTLDSTLNSSNIAVDYGCENPLKGGVVAGSSSSSAAAGDTAVVALTTSSSMTSSTNNAVQRKKSAGDLEWMYQLQENEKAEARRTELATKALGYLKKCDLSGYRVALRLWIEECYHVHDLYLVHRARVFLGSEPGASDADVLSQQGVDRSPGVGNVESTPVFSLQSQQQEENDEEAGGGGGQALAERSSSSSLHNGSTTLRPEDMHSPSAQVRSPGGTEGGSHLPSNKTRKTRNIAGDGESEQAVEEDDDDDGLADLKTMSNTTTTPAADNNAVIHKGPLDLHFARLLADSEPYCRETCVLGGIPTFYDKK